MDATVITQTLIALGSSAAGGTAVNAFLSRKKTRADTKGAEAVVADVLSRAAVGMLDPVTQRLELANAELRKVEARLKKTEERLESTLTELHRTQLDLADAQVQIRAMQADRPPHPSGGATQERHD